MRMLPDEVPREELDIAMNGSHSPQKTENITRPPKCGALSEIAYWHRGWSGPVLTDVFPISRFLFALVS